MYSYDRRTAGAINNQAWERLIRKVIDEAMAMKKQVDRFGGIENALREGHGTTLKSQLTETASALRVLDRNIPT